MDVFSKQKRKQIMSKITGKNTKPEMTVRRYLFNLGYRYRLHRADLPGKPDIVLLKYNTAVFINGCFWHGHQGCNRSKLPHTNRDFWACKIQANRLRDVENYKELEKLGWNVILIWECELSSIDKRKKRLLKLETQLTEAISP